MDQRRSTKSLKQVILDASILVKIVLPENSEGNITQVLKLFNLFISKKIKIILPIFWQFEVGNTLLRKMSEELFIEKFSFLLSQSFEEYRFNTLENLTIGKFAKRHQVSFYDASYHLLAHFTNSIFITADKKYYQKFKGDERIAPLENLKLS